MADRDNGLDAMVAAFGDGAADRDSFRANGNTPDIGVDIDAGDDAAVARAKRRADLLPFVAVTLLDRAGGGFDQFLVFLRSVPLVLLTHRDGAGGAME